MKLLRALGDEFATLEYTAHKLAKDLAHDQAVECLLSSVVNHLVNLNAKLDALSGRLPPVEEDSSDSVAKLLNRWSCSLTIREALRADFRGLNVRCRGALWNAGDAFLNRPLAGVTEEELLSLRNIGISLAWAIMKWADKILEQHGGRP